MGRRPAYRHRPRRGCASQTNAADAVVFPSQVGKAHPDWARLAARPEVSTLAVWDLLFGNYNGQPGAVIFGSKDGTYLGKVDKPVVVQGRMFNPRSPDEVVVDENSVGQAPPVGGTFTYRFYARNQSDEDTAPPKGPKVTMHVVGVVREVPEFLFVSDGQVLVSPGFLAKYGPADTDGRERRRHPPPWGGRHGGTPSRREHVPRRSGHAGPRCARRPADG